MRYVTIAALLFISTSALAQMGSPPPPSQPPAVVDDGPGSGIQLELGVFSAGGVFNFANATLSGTGSVASASGISGVLGLEPSLSVGYQWLQNALLFGVDFSAVGGTGGGGPTLLFGVGPTFRRYFTPLRTGGFSAFGEGSVGLLMVAASGAPTSYGIEVAGGLGGEWLFVKNFGLFAKASLGYGHISANGTAAVGFGGTTTITTNLDGIGLSGDIGLSVHL